MKINKPRASAATQKPNRLLAKFAAGSKVQGASKRKTGAYTPVCEDLSTEATQQFANDYIRLMRLDKPIGILLLLWPTLWALWISAQGIPQSPILLIFILGVILMRTAGCIINDIADRDFDHKVKRTQDRPLTTRVIKVKHALILFGMLCLLCLGLVLLLNKLTIYLAESLAGLSHYCTLL